MDQSVFTRKHLHECTEVRGGNDRSCVGRSNFTFGEHLLDHLHRTVKAFLLGSVNVHGAIVFDVDVSTRLSLDTFDVLSSWPNEFTDALGIDLS